MEKATGRLGRFMRRFMDPRCYTTYTLCDGVKSCFPAVTRQRYKGDFIRPKGHEWSAHRQRKHTIGYWNRPGADEWLLMLDLDTDKASPTRRDDLKSSMRVLRQTLGVRIYFEKSTYGDDIHGYIRVNELKSKSSFLRRRTVLDAIKVLSQRLPLKKLEVMGLPATYRYESGKPVERLHDGTNAKVPRVRGARVGRLEATGTVSIRLLERIASEWKAKEPKEVPPVKEEEKRRDLLTEHQSSSLTESNAIRLSRLWTFPSLRQPVAESQDKTRYITKEQFTDYATAWMLTVTRFDRPIDGRRDDHRSTVSTQEVARQYERLTGRKANLQLSRWTMRHLVAAGVILVRNPKWSQGTCRKMTWSWAQLDSGQKSSYVVCRDSEVQSSEVSDGKEGDGAEDVRLRSDHEGDEVLKRQPPEQVPRHPLPDRLLVRSSEP